MKAKKQGEIMSDIGKALRMRRLMKSSRIILTPLDHGVGIGPIKGLESMAQTVSNMREGGADSVLVHKGVVKSISDSIGGMGLVVHCSAATSISTEPNDKVLVCSVEEAIALGADAISVHVNLGAESEKEMLADFAGISNACAEYGMPLLAMMYVRGHDAKESPENIAIAARCAYELGADIIKVPYTGSRETFEKVVKGVDVPVAIAGGAKSNDERQVLQSIRDALDAGAAGVSIGRNIFQHAQPVRMLHAIGAIVHKDKGVDDAMAVLREK